MLGNAVKRKYNTNCQFMSFMFIFRHTVELMLKYNIDDNSQNVPKHHKISDLSDLLSLPPEFIDNLSPLNCAGTGDCFRYLTTNDSSLSLSNTPIQLLPTVYNFIHNGNSGLVTLKLETHIDNDSRILNHKLTFHPSECRSLGVVRTHYDYTIATLIESVNDGGIDVNTIYLPLMFLIRHSVELALKDSLLRISDQLSDSQKRKLNNEHSISTLYNLFNNIVGEAITRIPPKDILFVETNTYHSTSKELCNMIHNLDAKSLSYRFPYELKMEGDLIYETYILYNKVDAYLTFAVDVLFQGGYLDINSKYLNEY